MEENEARISTVDAAIAATERRGRKKTVKTEKKQEVLKMGEFVEVGSNWIPEEEGDMVEGYVGPVHIIKTSIGQAQSVIVGDKRVLISAGLNALLGLEGQYVRITYEGKEPSKTRKGVEFRKFKVERRVEE